MKWTMGLLLLAAAGCGYRQTKMVACAETGCPDSYAASSPQGTRHTPRVERVEPMPMTTLPPPSPDAPMTDTTPPPPNAPVPTP